MESKKLNDKFRKKLAMLHALMVVTVFIFELVGYALLISIGDTWWAWGSWSWWRNVMIPTILNLLTHLTAMICIKSPKITQKGKNTVIIVALMITSFVVALFHREFPVTCCAFVFPIILSAMFNNKQLLKGSFGATVLQLLCVAGALWWDGKDPLELTLDMIVLLGFAVVAFFCGVFSINFSQQNEAIIRSQAKSNSKLREDVLRDQMTGLYAHQAFLAQLQVQASTATDTNVPFCLVMMDLDDFKRVNDTYGHDCGDEVLLHFAKTLHRRCSMTDTAYRYGGEEFAVIFRGKRAGEVYDTVQDILSYFRGYRFSFTDSPITFSAGICQYAPGMTGERLFEAADRTLYAAKRAGKNQVMICNTYEKETAR